MNTIGANTIPITGIMLSQSPVNMLTVMAIPPVERHNANSLAYDNMVPRNPVDS